jgi:hypothetical protein
MINGVRVRDSGVELSPTGTDCREARERASNRAVRASSAIAAGSTRWLMRRTKRPLSAKVACYFIVNFRIPPNFSSILKPTALQILVRRRKQSCSTASLIFGYFWSGAAPGILRTVQQAIENQHLDLSERVRGKTRKSRQRGAI